MDWQSWCDMQAADIDKAELRHSVEEIWVMKHQAETERYKREKFVFFIKIKWEYFFY